MGEPEPERRHQTKQKLRRPQGAGIWPEAVPRTEGQIRIMTFLELTHWIFIEDENKAHLDGKSKEPKPYLGASADQEVDGPSWVVRRKKGSALSQPHSGSSLPAGLIAPHRSHYNESVERSHAVRLLQASANRSFLPSVGTAPGRSGAPHCETGALIMTIAPITACQLLGTFTMECAQPDSIERGAGPWQGRRKLTLARTFRGIRRLFWMKATSAPRRQRKIQEQVAKADRNRPKLEAQQAMQAGARAYPEPPFPRQHQRKPGREARLNPPPLYDAPFYLGSRKLENKVALITGGDSGIGRAVAILFAREGADVAVAYLNEHGDARITKEKIEAEGRKCILIAGDVSDQKFCDRAVAKTVNELGGLDVLVNNAAFQVHAARFEDLTAQALRRNAQNQPVRILLYGTGGGEANEAGRGDRQYRLSDRIAGKRVSARLLNDQGRHPCFHEVTGHAIWCRAEYG